MHPDISQSKDHNALTAAESTPFAPSTAPGNRLARRSFLRNLGIGAALLAPGAALLGNAGNALAANDKQKKKSFGGNLPKGDVAILQLLAAAELLEADLWQQYNELEEMMRPIQAIRLAWSFLMGTSPSTFPTTLMTR